jgi:hypothetical protein
MMTRWTGSARNGGAFENLLTLTVVMVEPDWKPRKRITLSNREYLKLARSVLARYRTCELCGKRRSESCHHAVPRGKGGDDVWENMVALCGSGTTGCHGEVETSREARHRLRDEMRDETWIYIVERMGVDWADRRYPVRS